MMSTSINVFFEKSRKKPLEQRAFSLESEEFIDHFSKKRMTGSSKMPFSSKT